MTFCVDNRQYVHCERASRRLMTLQVGRHWFSIVSLAQRKGIPLAHLGVHINHNSAPFAFKLFDCRHVSEQNPESPHILGESPLARLVAKETIRANCEPEEGLPICFMLVITHVGGVVVPYLAYQTIDGGLNEEPPDVQDGYVALFTDEEGEILYPGLNDLLQDSVLKAAQGTSLRELWRNDINPFKWLEENHCR